MRNNISEQPTLAVIGAGLSGMRCAALLAEAGYAVTVFEKSRGTGGRLAASRLDGLTTDLGIPYIETRQPDFRQWLDTHKSQVQRWQPRQTDFSLSAGQVDLTRELWVGVPRSSAITRALAANIQLRTETRVSVVWPDKNGVLLRDESAEMLGHFDQVVVAAPAPQAAPLLDAVQRFKARAERVQMQPAWIVSLLLETRPASLAHIDLIEGEHTELQRVLRDSSKPAREGEIWTLQASRQWSETYLNLSADTVMHEQVAALIALTGDPLVVKAHRVHRWLYCNAVSTETSVALWDADAAIGVCGDWVAGGGVEAAWQSGTELARMILSSNP